MEYCCLVTKLCLTLCDPMDGSPPGSSVHGISQARILEWVAISFTRGYSWPKGQIHIFSVSRWILHHRATRKAQCNEYCSTIKKNEILPFAATWMGVSLVVQLVKNPPVMRLLSLGREDPLEKEMTTHFSILAWEIPRTEEPGGLQSVGLHRVGHNWSNLAHKDRNQEICRIRRPSTHHEISWKRRQYFASSSELLQASYKDPLYKSVKFTGRKTSGLPASVLSQWAGS